MMFSVGNLNVQGSSSMNMFMHVLLLGITAVVITAHRAEHRIAHVHDSRLHTAHTEHTCIHDELDTTMTVGNPRSTRRVAAEQSTAEWNNIRIKFFWEDLINSQKYCTASGDVRPDYRSTSGTIACQANDVLTVEKRNIILQRAMPLAVQMLQSHLLVEHESSNLVLRGSNPCGELVTVPSNHSTVGIPNADFVIYVTAGPISSQSTLAFASACQYEPGTGRPIAGKINFNPSLIAWSATSNLTNDRYVRVAVHETTHALGFSATFFTQLPTVAGGGAALFTSTARGKSVKMIRSPTVLSVGRQYFGCTSLEGVEIEDEGGTGTAGSHWERRNLKEELMAGISDANLISNFTLALLQDLGFYRANFSSAEVMRWGANQGCDYLSQSCSATRGGLGREFCNDRELGCSFGYTAIGQCNLATYGSDLPATMRHYGDARSGGSSALMDYCAFVDAFSNLQCDEAQVLAPTDTLADHRLGFYFGGGGRCAAVTIDFAKEGAQYPTLFRCLQMRCLSSAQLQIAIAGVWHSCPSDGSSGVITPAAATSFSGSVTCPPAAEVCHAAELQFRAPVTTAQPITAAPTTTTAAPTLSPPSTATAAPTTTTSAPTTEPLATALTTCKITISTTPDGSMQTGWRRLPEVSISSALRDDISAVLGLPLSSFDVLGVALLPGSGSTASVFIGVNTTAGAKQNHQNANITSWNAALRTPVSAAAMTALYRSSLNMSSFQGTVAGTCVAAQARPAVAPTAAGRFVLGGNANLTRFFVNTAAVNRLKAAVAADLALVIGVSSRFIEISSVSLRANSSTTIESTYTVSLVAGITDNSPVSAWKAATASIETSNLIASETLTLYQSMGPSSSLETIGVASLEMNAPAPPSTPTPTTTTTTTTQAPLTPSTTLPQNSSSDLDRHCVLSSFNHCFWVEVGVAAVILLLILIFICRCYQKRKRNQESLARTKRKLDEDAKEQARRQQHARLQHRFQQAVHPSQNVAPQRSPHAAVNMVDLDADPFGDLSVRKASPLRPQLPHQQVPSPHSAARPPPPPPVRAADTHQAGRLQAFQQYERPRVAPNKRGDDLDDIL